LNLRDHGAVVGQERQLGQLLGNGAAALLDRTGAEVDPHRPGDAPEVDPVVVVEVVVLRREKGQADVFGDLVEADGHPVFRVQPGDDAPLGVVDVGGQLGIEVDLVQRGDAAEVPRDHAGGRADGDADRKGEGDEQKPPPSARTGLSRQGSDTSALCPRAVAQVLYHGAGDVPMPAAAGPLARGRRGML